MKRKIMSIVLLTTMVLSVGCSTKEENKSTVESSNTNIVSKKNDKELYEIHKNMFPKVKEVYKEYGFEVEEYENIDNEYYSGSKGMLYRIVDDVNHGDIYNARYEIGIEDDKAVKVYANLFMEVDPDEIKKNGFKMEGTFFEAMDKVMVGQDIDYSEVNQEIVDAYNNDGFLDSIKEYGNVSCRVTADGSMLSYTISIYPEE